MLCPNCAKLSILTGQKTCIQCQAQINNNVAVLCDFCSNTSKKCSVCLKKVISQGDRNIKRGCNCGRK